MQYNRLEFTSFPRTWGIITIPENFVVYRGGTKPPILGSDPRFFSDFSTADMYTRIQQNYKTYACFTNELKLMDIRTLRYLFLEYVGHNRLMFTDDEIGLIKKIKFALGLIPIQEQFDYIHNYTDIHTGLYHWKNKYPDANNIHDIEYDLRCNYEIKIGNGAMPMNFDENISYYMNFGNRASECSIDDYMVGLLKIIFKDTIDGYIAPTLETIWHDFNFHPELCLFDPSKSLKICTEVPTGITDPDSFIPPINIGSLLGTRVVADFDMMLGGSPEERQACKKNESTYFSEIKHNFTNDEDTTEKNIEVSKIWHVKEDSSNTGVEKTVPILDFSDVFEKGKVNSQFTNQEKSQVKTQVSTQVKKITIQNSKINSKIKQIPKTEIQDNRYDPELF